MTTAHAKGDDWPGYLAGRNAGFLPEFLSVWCALWSLAVAVSLPRAGTGRTKRFSFFSSPTFLNTHFIFGIVACSLSIMVPSFYCSHYYDAGIDHYRKAYAMLGEHAPAFAAMTTSEVDAKLAEVVPVVQVSFIIVDLS